MRCVRVLSHLNGLLAPAIGPRLLQVWEPSIEHNCGDDGDGELCGGRRWGCNPGKRLNSSDLFDLEITHLRHML